MYEWKDYFVEVAKGNVLGHDIIRKFGHNQALSSSWEDIWSTGGTYAWPTTASKLYLRSSEAADSTAGAGLQTVEIYGLDSEFSSISETVVTNGSGTSALTINEYLRVDTLRGGNVGTYANVTAGANIGIVTAYRDADGGVQGAVSVDNGLGVGTSEIARYTVPKGYLGYIVRGEIHSDSSKNPASVYLFSRENTSPIAAPYSSKQALLGYEGITGKVDMELDYPEGPYPQYTDIWWSGYSAGAGSDPGVGIHYSILLAEIGLSNNW